MPAVPRALRRAGYASQKSFVIGKQKCSARMYADSNPTALLGGLCLVWKGFDITNIARSQAKQHERRGNRARICPSLPIVLCQLSAERPFLTGATEYHVFLL